jgi:hypothetical protein
MYKAQGHNIRCFKNVEPYEAPTNLQNEEENTSEISEEIPYNDENEIF